MPTPVDRWDVDVLRANLVVRYHAVLFPFNAESLLKALPQIGWVVPITEVDEEGIRMSAAPSKGGAKLWLDIGNKVIGVHGNDLSETLAVFRELREFLSGRFPVSPEVRTHYAELQYVGRMVGQSNPAETLSAWWRDKTGITRLATVLTGLSPGDASEMGPYGVRLAPVGQDANRPNWAELTITPENVAGSHRYAFELLFRNENVDTTCRLAEQAADTIKKVLAELGA